VAALVDAEEVLPTRPGRAPERLVQPARPRAGRRRAEELDDEWREDRHEDEQHDERQRRERDAIPAQPAPEELKRRARGDGEHMLLGSREEGGHDGAHAGRFRLSSEGSE
jgi:hypothetical protein